MQLSKEQLRAMFYARLVGQENVDLAKEVYFAFLCGCGYVKREREKELIHLIECNPADVKLLKQEYKQLTGKQYRRKKGE